MTTPDAPASPSPPDVLLARARELDVADPLAAYRERFLVGENDDVVAYLDGNSLGRPLRAAAERLEAFVRKDWAGRLIRGWTDGWLHWPEQVGDQLGRVALGAGPGQVIVADSTSVLLYKLARAAVAARADRREIVLDTDNFPTDRYVSRASRTSAASSWSGSRPTPPPASHPSRWRRPSAPTPRWSA